jgi:SulP family sulfate permease
VAVATMLMVVLVGVQQGILLAIALSIVAHLRHSYRPWNRLLVRFEGKVWKSLPLDSEVQARQGLVIYRFGASLYYANAARFVEEVVRLARSSGEPIRWFCLAMETVGDIDFTATEVLERVIKGLQENGITFVACDVQDPVRRELERDGLLALIGPEHVYGDTDDVIKAYKNETGISDPPDDEIAEQAAAMESLQTEEPAWWLPGAHRRAVE